MKVTVKVIAVILGICIALGCAVSDLCMIKDDTNADLPQNTQECTEKETEFSTCSTSIIVAEVTTTAEVTTAETTTFVARDALPANQPDSFVLHAQVPILMYHEVNDLCANSLYLSVKDFTSHLDSFERAGITPITLRQLYEHWEGKALLPEKPIVLTFDDGYVSMYTTVYPMLKERGWSGTFFCITSTLGKHGHLTKEMIAEMAANGMEIGSHTVSHVELNALGGERLLNELSISQSTLADIVGGNVDILCYPVGRYNAQTISAAKETGYLCAVTTKHGIASRSQGNFELNRLRISLGRDAKWLEQALSPLGY